MGKKKRTKTIEFLAQATSLYAQMEGSTKLMAEMMNIQPDDTPEEIVARTGYSLEYSDNLFNVPFLVRKDSDIAATIIIAQNLDKRDARVFAAQAMAYTSSLVGNPDKNSFFHKMGKGETCHPAPSNKAEGEYYEFAARVFLMPKEKLRSSIRLHQIGSRVNMKAVAADFNVRLDYAMKRAEELCFIDLEG